MTFDPNHQYVTSLLNRLQNELKGFHTKINEIEALRYLEDQIELSPEERIVGLEVHVGLTAELIENVKAALTTNIPKVRIIPHRKGEKAAANASKREKFWNSCLRWFNYPVPTLNELADSQVGLGLGILKASYVPWPKKERKKKKNENNKDYLARQEALKKMWGPPFGLITVHPHGYFFSAGIGNRISESVEHSWKQKVDIDGTSQMPGGSDHTPGRLIPSLTGQPQSFVSSLPSEVDTSSMELVTEYWNRGRYKVFINSQEIFNEEEPGVSYFIATGRTTSSKDPDKIGLSVAESLRPNERIINRVLTRMAEASDIAVRKKLIVEVPEGSSEGFSEEGPDKDNNPIPRTFDFRSEVTEALPPGFQIKDPFEGVEKVYDALPFLNLMMGIMAQHGVSPIFKGAPPGAAGSGYRDNSLYMMAKAQFKYLLDSYQNCMIELVKWLEFCLVHHVKQEIWCNDESLSPEDVKDWPATIEITIEPDLPQNLIAEGSFWDRMHMQGHVTRKTVLENLGKEQPEEEEYERMLENLQTALMPILMQDVITHVTQQSAIQPGEGAAPPDPGSANGQQPRGPGGAQQILQGSGGSGRPAGRELGGQARAGVARQPPQEPGSFPPGQEPPR